MWYSYCMLDFAPQILHVITASLHFFLNVPLIAIMSAIAFFILPGLTLLLVEKKAPSTWFVALIQVVAISLSYWICSFPLLKFIPLSHTNLFYLSSGIFLLVCIIQLIVQRFKFTNTNQSPSVIDVLIITLISLFFASLSFIQDVPAGADMTTHSYIARVILEKNGYPTTFKPIVPIEHFGFSPTGMPSLIALWTQITQMPFHHTTMMFTSLTYILLTGGIYVMLTNFFSSRVSTITTIILIFIGKDLTSYLSWGAIPTVLSVSFLFIFLDQFVKIISNTDRDIRLASGIAALVFTAAFITHQIPPVVFFYGLVPFGVYLLFQKKNSQHYFSIGLFITLFILFSLAFFTSIKPISKDTREFLIDWQRNHDILSMRGDAYTAIIGVPNLVKRKIGIDLLLVIFLGIITTLTQKKKLVDKFFLYSLGVYFVLLLNSKYWFLPLSELLYPDRVTTTAHLMMAYFTAKAIEKLISMDIWNSIKNHSSKIEIIIAASFLLYGGHLFIYTMYLNAEFIVNQSTKFSSVTKNDMAAFQWLSDNTSSTDVIANNYGDAGIWIPALVARTINHNDAAPHDFDELHPTEKKLKPNYIYIGDKQIYPENIGYYKGSFANDPGYQRVFTAGKAVIYRKID